MILIDGDKIVTAQLYDDEHEEFTEKKMSIIDFVNVYTDEGVTIAADVLDKIIAEIETDLSHFCFDDWGNENTTWKEVKAIIDKYKVETEKA